LRGPEALALKTDPTGCLVSIDRELSRRSLLEFVRAGWQVLPKHYSHPFISGWVVEAICEHLEAVSRGEIKRLLINVPPGFSKSMVVNVFWPAWEWGPCGRPSLSYISVSHSSENTMRDNVYGRDLMDSEWYRDRWGHVFGWKSDQNAKGYYENDRGGSRFAGAMRKGITGKRADRVILDDPHDVMKAESLDGLREAQRYFAETLPTRVNDQEGTPFVIIMQRVHERDVSGFVLAKDLGYEHLCVPMEYEPDHPRKSTRFEDPRTEAGELAWPERFSRKSVEGLKKTFRAFGGTYAEAGQLQQRPTPRGGGMFHRSDFKVLQRAPDPKDVLAECRGWDFAATEDEDAAYTASVRMAMLRDGSIVIVHASRAQLEPREMYEFVRSQVELDGPGIPQSMPQDPGSAGKDQKRHVAAELHGFQVKFSTESGSKESRAVLLANQGEAGNLYVLGGQDWNDAFVTEATSFPRGEFKDQVDAASRAYAFLVKKARRGKRQKVAAGPHAVTG